MKVKDFTLLICYYSQSKTTHYLLRFTPPNLLLINNKEYLGRQDYYTRPKMTRTIQVIP